MLEYEKNGKILVECSSQSTYVIDNLFDSSKLDEVMLVLQKMDNWHTSDPTLMQPYMLIKKKMAKTP